MSHITARRQIRLAAVAALRTIPGVTVLSPGNMAAPPVRLPEIRVRCGPDRKSSPAKASPDFNTTVTLEIQARALGVTAEDAQDAIESLGQLIEVAVLSAPALLRLTSAVSSITTQTDIDSTGDRHIAAADISVEFEVFESFDPAELLTLPMLDGATVHVDCVDPFDASGTYTGTAFPGSITSAPRTSGPDGRDEALLHINLNT